MSSSSFVAKLFSPLSKIFGKQDGVEAHLYRWAVQCYDLMAEQVVHWVEADRLKMEDKFDLRFEIAVFWMTHMMAEIKKRYPQRAAELNQALWNATFEGFDWSLRERGVVDIRMNARMRKLFTHAHGRRNAYVAALEQGDDDLLKQSIVRNILDGKAEIDDERVEQLVQSLDDIAQIVEQNPPPAEKS
uniref:Ubiquinol-cytochrome c chaperone domain-containing protein n=1 Tax=Magnetococcus massalia (strain MO-1) TaxID=451514 RepID=A0A1S7LET6_MAGMO|nr:conserved protein of unknown function [Candidatus Magnetococcus massalia]